MNTLSPACNDDDCRQEQKKYSVWVLILVLIWIIAVVAAYVKAWQCTDSGLRGGDARKVANLLVVPLLGPFWWILYWSQKGNYCQPL